MDGFITYHCGFLRNWFLLESYPLHTLLWRRLHTAHYCLYRLYLLHLQNTGIKATVVTNILAPQVCFQVDTKFSSIVRLLHLQE